MCSSHFNVTIVDVTTAKRGQTFQFDGTEGALNFQSICHHQHQNHCSENRSRSFASGVKGTKKQLTLSKLVKHELDQIVAV